MMISVLQPWEPVFLLSSGGGLTRSPCSCQHHRVSNGFPLIPCDDRNTLGELFEQTTPSPSMFNLQQTLQDILRDSSEFGTFAQPRKSSCRTICEKNSASNFVGGRVLRPIQWQLNKDKDEARAEIQLPRGLRRLDDLNVELDEVTRTITLKAESESGPDNCRIFAWAHSQRLDDSIDLSQLQASVDFHNGRLLLRAPTLQAPDSTQEVTPRSFEAEPQKVNEGEEINSEEEQPPESDVDISSDDESDMEDTTVGDAAEPGQPSTCGINTKKEMEIEDVGPDEDSDRISLSSGGTTRSNS